MCTASVVDVSAPDASTSQSRAHVVSSLLFHVEAFLARERQALEVRRVGQRELPAARRHRGGSPSPTPSSGSSRPPRPGRRSTRTRRALAAPRRRGRQARSRRCSGPARSSRPATSRRRRNPRARGDLVLDREAAVHTTDGRIPEAVRLERHEDGGREDELRGRRTRPSPRRAASAPPPAPRAKSPSARCSPRRS